MSDETPEEFVIAVPGKPVPWTKGAPPGKGPQVPSRQAHHMELIRATWNHHHGQKGIWLPKGKPVQLVCDFWIARPKDQYGTGANEKEPHSIEYAKPAKTYPTGKPDLTNLLKMAEDGLKGVAWADDDQVVNCSGSKRLVHWWERERSVIRVTPLPFENLWDYEQHRRQRELGEAEAHDRVAQS